MRLSWPKASGRILELGRQLRCESFSQGFDIDGHTGAWTIPNCLLQDPDDLGMQTAAAGTCAFDEASAQLVRHSDGVWDGLIRHSTPA